MRVAADSTNVSVMIRIVDSTDGTPETGVTSATGGLALGYWREGAASFVGLTESDLATLDAAHSDGGMLHINAGMYRVDVPDAAFATGVDRVLIGGEATDMVVVGQIVEIGPVIANATQISGDATAADNLELDYDGTGYNKSNSTIGTAAALTANNDKTGYALSSAGVQAIWDALTSALTTVGSIGKLLVDNINAAIGSRSSHSAADVWTAVTRTLTAGTKDTEIDAIKAKTDNLPAAPAATGDIPSAATVADSVWDEAKAGHVAAGSFGEEVQAHALSSEVSALNDITVAEILAATVEGSLTLVQAQRIMLAVLAGKSTGGGTTSVDFRDLADTKDRVAATVDENGNRTAVTLDGT